MLAVAPFLVHRDPRLFPECPGEFAPLFKAALMPLPPDSSRGPDGRSDCVDGLAAIPGASAAGISFGGGNFR